MERTTIFLALAIVTMILLIVVPINSYACSFEEKFEWVKQTFEENDAGVPHILERRGQAAYEAHNRMILERIRSAESMNEFLQISWDWLRFFRSGHHQIMLNPNLITADLEQNEEEAEESTVSQPIHYSWNGDIDQFIEYVDTLDDKTSYEGIWDIGGAYAIGIIREGDSYIGFIIESAYEEWLPNMIKLRIDTDGDDVVSTFYVRDFSPEVSETPTMIGNNLMRMGNNRDVKRIKPMFPDSPYIVNYLRFITSIEPFFEKINEYTLYFRLPIFSDCTDYLEEIIKENIALITSTENLIIDLRNNPGGGAATPLLEYLFTNPIVSPTEFDFYATQSNIQQVYDLSQGINLIWDSIEEEFRDDMMKFSAILYELIKDKVGEFVELSVDTTVVNAWLRNGRELISYDKIYQYPKNVGIIANRGTGSAAEHYIISAKQSNKVKVFGEPTFGAVDTGFITVGGFLESPCGEIWLRYSNARFANLPGLIFDDIGIQPDFFIDNTVPDYRWVEHVTEIMNGWLTGTETRRRRGRR